MSEEPAQVAAANPPATWPSSFVATLVSTTSTATVAALTRVAPSNRVTLMGLAARETPVARRPSD